MADEIKQPGNVGKVQPLNPSRGAGQRKRPKPLDRRPGGDARQPRADPDRPHHVDEYV